MRLIFASIEIFESFLHYALTFCHLNLHFCIFFTLVCDLLSPKFTPTFLSTIIQLIYWIVLMWIVSWLYEKRQKQSPEVSEKKGVLKNFANFTGNHLCCSLILIKLQACKPISKNICKRLLLKRCFTFASLYWLFSIHPLVEHEVHVGS